MTRRIVFVTGGAGFIGSNIVAKLAEDHALDLVVCDRLRGTDTGKWRNLAKHPIGDLVAPEGMWEWLEKRWREVELIIHMGAISSTTESDADKKQRARSAGATGWIVKPFDPVKLVDVIRRVAA